jgi:hypothetical protein
MLKKQIYRPRDWYWIVAGSTTHVFLSKAKAYVPVDNVAYVAWLVQGNLPTGIESEASLLKVLAEQAPDCLPDNAAGIEARRVRLLKQATTLEIGKALLEVLFNHENRIRVLERKTALTKAQFLAAIKGLF